MDAVEQRVHENQEQAHRIIRSLSAKYPHLDIHVINSTVMVTLWEAAQKFKPTPGNDFAGYYGYLVNKRMMDALREEGPMSRPESKAYLRGEKTYGKTNQIVRGYTMSLNNVIDGDGDNDSEWINLLASEDDYEFMEMEDEDFLEQTIALLSPRLQHVVRYLYWEGLTMRETGERMGVTESRISQLNEVALRRLHANWGKKVLPKKRPILASPLRKQKGPATLRPMNTTLEQVTPRELEVMELVALGYTNDEVAAQLIISVETVKSHIKHILAKLEVRNATAAVAMLIRAGSL